jgi:hypothetical protein
MQCAGGAVMNDNGDLKCENGAAPPPVLIPPTGPMLSKWSGDVPKLPFGLETLYPEPVLCSCVHLHMTDSYPNARTATLTNKCHSDVTILAEMDDSKPLRYQAMSKVVAAPGKLLSLAPLGVSPTSGFYSSVFNVDGNKFAQFFTIQCSEGSAVTDPNAKQLFTVD